MKTTSSTSASDRRSKKRGCLARFLRFVLGVTALLAVSLLAGWFWLQSQPGKAWLADCLSARLSGIGGQEILVTGLAGQVPFDMTVDEITLADGAGVWCTARGLAWRWSWRALWRERLLNLPSLTAVEIRVNRLPRWTSVPRAERTLRRPAVHVPSILVETAAVDRVVLGEALLGQEAAYRVSGRFHSQPGLEDVAGFLSIGEIGANGTLVRMEAGCQPSTGRIDLEATLRVEAGTVTHRLLQGPPTGDLAADLKGSGTASGWHGTGRLSSASWGRAEFALAAAWRPHAWLNVTGQVTSTAAALAAFPTRAEFALTSRRSPDGSWSVRPTLRGEGSAWAILADARIDPSARVAEGNVEASLARLAPWLEPFGLCIEGNADLQAAVVYSARKRTMDLCARLRDVVSDYGGAETVLVNARLPDFLDPTSLDAEVAVTNAARGAVAVRALAAQVARRGEVWDVEAQAEGGWHQPFAVDGETRITLNSHRQAFAVEHIELVYADMKAAVLAPFTVVHEDGGWGVETARVSVAEAVVSLSGDYARDAVHFAAFVTNLSLRTLPFPAAAGLPAGPVDARVLVTGHPSRPVVNLQAWIADVLPEAFRMEGMAQAGASFGASITNGAIEVAVSATAPGAGALEAEASTPLTFSLQPFALSWSPERYLKGRLQADLDLAFLNRFGFAANQDVRGRLTADLGFDGPLRETEAKGAVQIRQGTYQHHGLGLAVQDVSADLRVRDGSLLLERCEGTDGGAGRWGASGHMDLQPSARWPFALQLTGRQATVVRLDHVTAAATSSLAVTGNTSVVSVDGNVTFDSGEFRIDLLPPAPPPVLHVQHVGRDEERSPTPAEASAAPPAITLKGLVEVDVGGPFFVRGRGIDSAWGGHVRLQSDGGPWMVSGSLRPRRGTYAFFGKRFTLVDSRVNFDGSYPSMPMLDITAEYERREILARLRITGRMDDPRLAVESVPERPQDEIMAQVMFGASASRLTPLQTARVGLAVASMARRDSGGGSFDVLGRTRDALRVDELGLREDAADASRVELVAGRFVSDRLFLEYSQRVGSREAGVRTEFEINRHLSVETNAGAQMRPGIRLNIKVDY